jgi:hypothetical protein
MYNSFFKETLSKNLFEALILQRDLIGSYVKKNMKQALYQIRNAMEYMSFIKLEILGRRKRELYTFKKELLRKRGSMKNLKRSSKQYFWTFNGEFWADELGDYVFALKSECK